MLAIIHSKITGNDAIAVIMNDSIIFSITCQSSLYDKMVNVNDDIALYTGATPYYLIALNSGSVVEVHFCMAQRTVHLISLFVQLYAHCFSPPLLSFRLPPVAIKSSICDAGFALNGKSCPTAVMNTIQIVNDIQTL